MSMRKQIIRSWLKSAWKWVKEASKEKEVDVIGNRIKSDTKINKALGLPPTDKWCEKNPYRFL